MEEEKGKNGNVCIIPLHDSFRYTAFFKIVFFLLKFVVLCLRAVIWLLSALAIFYYLFFNVFFGEHKTYICIGFELRVCLVNSQ